MALSRPFVAEKPILDQQPTWSGRKRSSFRELNSHRAYACVCRPFLSYIYSVVRSVRTYIHKWDTRNRSWFIQVENILLASSIGVVPYSGFDSSSVIDESFGKQNLKKGERHIIILCSFVVIMIEVLLDDRLGKKVRVKCNEDDTIGDLKKLAAAQLGTRPEKLRIQKWYTVYKVCHLLFILCQMILFLFYFFGSILDETITSILLSSDLICRIE